MSLYKKSKRLSSSKVLALNKAFPILKFIFKGLGGSMESIRTFQLSTSWQVSVHILSPQVWRKELSIFAFIDVKHELKPAWPPILRQAQYRPSTPAPVFLGGPISAWCPPAPRTRHDSAMHQFTSLFEEPLPIPAPSCRGHLRSPGWFRPSPLPSGISQDTPT